MPCDRTMTFSKDVQNVKPTTTSLEQSSVQQHTLSSPSQIAKYGSTRQTYLNPSVRVCWLQHSHSFAFSKRNVTQTMTACTRGTKRVRKANRVMGAATTPSMQTDLNKHELRGSRVEARWPT